ncbi:CDC42 small effector protein 2-like [Scleropages formosus]|uniref:CDC42 small effector protein 2-like n=1 Tax=Scleropages formosus TaxID=113540 RepID=A0A0P7UWR1_SCLFO|nr:CDC42 small effector protein 2-like [Scleropages formosus]
MMKRRRRIDRSMIGEPTNFVHTAHVGSGDLFSGMNSVSQPGRTSLWVQGEISMGWAAILRSPRRDPHHVNSIQNQMQSKGGYAADALPVNVQMQLVDTKAG